MQNKIPIFSQKKKSFKTLIIVLAILLLIPIPMQRKDGGTVEYCAILYKLIVWHQINPNADEYDNDGHYIGSEPEFLTGTSFYIFPFNFSEKVITR